MLESLVPSFVRRRYAARLAVVLLVAVALFSVVGYTSVDRVGDTVSSYLRGQVRRHSDSVRAIHVVDLTNRTIRYSSDPSAVGTSPSAPWSSAPLSVVDPSEAWVSSASYEGPEGTAVLAFASRSPADPDRVVVVVASVEAHARQLYGTVENQSTSVVNARGGVVTRGEDSRLSGTQSGEGGITVDNAAMIAAGDGETTFLTERGRVFAYAPVPETDSMVRADELYRRWVVVTSMPTDRAFEAANQAETAAAQTRAAAEQARATASAVTGSVGGLVLVALLTLGGFGAVVGYQTIRPLSALRERAKRMEEGDLDVDLETEREDEIGRLYGSFAEMRDALRERIREAERARKEAESAREAAEESRRRVERLNEELERTAENYSEVTTACAAGDLTRRMDPDTDHESMQSIAGAFNEMLDDLEATLQAVQTFATEVATESQEVTAGAQEVRNASQQVTESIQEISDGAAEQDERLQAVSAEMESLSTTTDEIATSANEVAAIAERTAETGRTGREAARDAADVAKETNMLALNANIEAIRGEDDDGGGFAAVAEQVKEFAADTREAAEEIEQRLAAIQTQADTTAAEVRESDRRIEANAEDIENAIEALDDVAAFAEETNEGIQETSRATQQQASSVEEVVAMVDQVAEIGERTARESEHVASAAQQQTAAMNDVSESADDLARRAGELSEALDRFETGSEAETPGVDAVSGHDGESPENAGE